MSLVLDALYLLALLIASPWILFRNWKRKKSSGLLLQRFLGVNMIPMPTGGQKTVWLHGVSVGEIHLLRQVVAAIRLRFPECHCVVSASTEGGLEEARKAFPILSVIPFPLDFSWAIRKTLRSIKPDLVVLAESELWPNFLRLSQLAKIPVAVINARMSPRTLGRYQRHSWLARLLFTKVSAFGVQDPAMAQFLKAIGLPSQSIQVTGSVKFDGVCNSKNDPMVQKFRELFSLTENEIVWVAGSTQDPEEQYILSVFAKLRLKHKSLRLILAPRQPSLFDQAANLLSQSNVSFIRRSQMTGALTVAPDVLLLDSLGELRHVWGLADIGFVGGSLDGKRGGQNMIEPAAYGIPVLFGPHIWNFKDISRELIHAGGATMIHSTADLEQAVDHLLSNPLEAKTMGENGRRYVLSQQGATEKTLNLLQPFLNQAESNLAA